MSKNIANTATWLTSKKASLMVSKLHGKRMEGIGVKTMKSWCDLSVFWELQEEIYSSSSTNFLYTSSTILTVSFLTEISCHLWSQWVAHQPEPEPAPHPNPKNPNSPTLFSFTPHTGSAHCLILSSKALSHPPHHIQSALTRRCSLAAHQFRGQASDTHLATIMHDSKAKD